MYVASLKSVPALPDQVAFAAACRVIEFRVAAAGLISSKELPSSLI